MTERHESPFSGTWYPDHAGALDVLLDDLFERSRRRTGPYLQPGALGFVVPHAGPVYSGAVAAAAYRSIERQKPERVVVIGFPHRGGLRGVGMPDVGSVATPLGAVKLDREFCSRLTGSPIVSVPERRVCDHSVEIQLPFLQRAAPEALVTLLYAGQMDESERNAAADTLAAAWEPGVVFLASSDFTHYGPDFGFVPFPADESTPDRIRNLDFAAIDAAGGLNASRFLESLERTGSTVCGAAPIALLLAVLERLGGGRVFQETLDYQTSGELAGDHTHSVSYAALGYYPATAFDLDARDRAALLASAEETLSRLRRTGKRVAVPPANGSAALGVHRGVFVSLHCGPRLLGCLGQCPGREPLARAVPELALAAALDDPRFPPAAEEEGEIAVEISVLTPLRPIGGAEEFVVGRHGGLLERGSHRGLLLPQVADARDWTAEDFLSCLSRKSGLGPQAWREPRARISVFEAQIISREREQAAPEA